MEALHIIKHVVEVLVSALEVEAVLGSQVVRLHFLEVQVALEYVVLVVVYISLVEMDVFWLSGSQNRISLGLGLMISRLSGYSFWGA